MKEIEFKYNASNISMAEYTDFCISRSPTKTISISGYDHFYSNPSDPESFLRHRVGPDMNQLTFKRKLEKDNNFIRTEHNIDLNEDTSKEVISSFCTDLNYTYNTSIFKIALIYQYEWYNMVYYVCFDTNMVELGRFVEIEINEEFSSSQQDEAWNELITLEKLYKPLGLNSKNRITKSLFELYRK